MRADPSIFFHIIPAFFSHHCPKKFPSQGWLRTYRKEWLFYMAKKDLRCEENPRCKPEDEPPGNPAIKFDCTWISNNRYHFPNYFGASGLCDLPDPYGSFFRSKCCRSCHSKYTLVGQDWRAFIRAKYVPDAAYKTPNGPPIQHLCRNKVKLSPWKVSMIHANTPPPSLRSSPLPPLPPSMIPNNDSWNLSMTNVSLCCMPTAPRYAGYTQKRRRLVVAEPHGSVRPHR